MAHLRRRNLTSSVTKRTTKRSIVIEGHKISVSLEEKFWNSLKEIASERGTTPSALVAAIDGARRFRLDLGEFRFDCQDEAARSAASEAFTVRVSEQISRAQDAAPRPRKTRPKSTAQQADNGRKAPA
jgi:predicted DNA-binding ribbon-helix-helix protein